MERADVLLIGAAIADVLLRPVDETVFMKGSCPVDSIRMDVGGDALNEATVLARLGHAPVLATVLGADGVADFILAHCRREGIHVCARRREELDTGINAVLVSPSGERSFITNRNGSLRRLTLEDALSAVDEAPDSVRLMCLASMFVSPMLDADGMAALFARGKARGWLVCADSTKRKNGETLRDVADALAQLDFIFPNLEEARLLTGREAPDDVADALLGAGVKNVALKLGGNGCLVKNASERFAVPAYPGAKCVDTTGAGDTFAAAFIASILEGRSIAQCAAFANAAASLCVERLGATAAPMNRDELEKRYRHICDLGDI